MLGGWFLSPTPNWTPVLMRPCQRTSNPQDRGSQTTRWVRSAKLTSRTSRSEKQTHGQLPRSVHESSPPPSHTDTEWTGFINYQCQQKVAVPNQRWGKKRPIMQDKFANPGDRFRWEPEVHSSETKGRPAFSKVPALVPDWSVFMQVGNPNL